MSFTVFLGNLPTWVTADDIKGWLTAENLVADAIKVIRNPETQESKGFAFIEAPNAEEMNSIIRRFDRAPLEDRLLRANPAQPPKPKGQVRPGGSPTGSAGPGGYSGGQRYGSYAPSHGGQAPTGQAHSGAPPATQSQGAAQDPSQGPAQGQGAGQGAAAGQGPNQGMDQRPPRRSKKPSSGGGPRRSGSGGGSQSAFAEELAKAL